MRVIQGDTLTFVMVCSLDKQEPAELSMMVSEEYQDSCEDASERNIECVVNKELMMQTKQRVIMRILYYQCVNGVSFLSGY